jgi:phosphatidate cytidylyltransferase
MVITAAAQHEFYAMGSIDRIYGVLGIAAGILLLFMAYGGGGTTDDFTAAAIMVFAVTRLFSKKTAEHASRDISLMLTGLVYIPLLMSYQIKLREFGPQWIIYVDSCVWAADSAAYYIGKGFGRKKLYEAISPKKTVAGAYGSVGGALIIAVIFNYLFVKTLTLPQALLIGLIIGVVSIIGDLVESLFKRDFGIKDSSTLIPGHGGFLDKIDGFVFVTPVVYWTLTRIIVI